MKRGEQIDSEEENTDTEADERVTGETVGASWNERRILQGSDR